MSHSCGSPLQRCFHVDPGFEVEKGTVEYLVDKEPLVQNKILDRALDDICIPKVIDYACEVANDYPECSKGVIVRIPACNLIPTSATGERDRLCAFARCVAGFSGH